jgi:Skp family chaperone for outer membrane proteins
MNAGGRLLIAVACSLVAVSAFAQVPNQTQLAMAGVRLGWFSPQRAFSESSEGKAGIARLTALQSEKARVIEEKNKELRVQEQALQNATLLNDEARKQRGSAVERFRIDVQRLIQDAQAELMGVQRDVESAFLFKVMPVVEKVAMDKGLQFVFNLDGGQIAWADPSMDITADVIKRLTLTESLNNR